MSLNRNVDTILKKGLLPFVQTVYPEGHRFYQDNDPKHKSKYAMTYMRENNINYWPTPAESPDLNPIEMMWAELKNYIRKTVKPSKKEELIKGIKDFWQTVSVAKCNKYVDHIFKVLPIVVERDGRASGHKFYLFYLW